jgi:O-methyltransferase
MLNAHAFRDTSTTLVLSKMVKPENVIIRKGYFPETAAGLNERFCFVSLDADLYQPILNGLEYFYPRLEHGGYIFVHDFDSLIWTGVKAAVLDYCSKNRISYVPILDRGGSVIITK